jgi:hypothetical protein
MDLVTNTVIDGQDSNNSVSGDLSLGITEIDRNLPRHCH